MPNHMALIKQIILYIAYQILIGLLKILFLVAIYYKFGKGSKT